MQRSNRVRGAILVASALSIFFAGASAQAVTRNMVGSVGVINPSVEPPFFFEVGPGVFGKKAGPYAPTDGWKTISVDGTTTSTFVGRQVTLPANKMNFSGIQFRDFPAFPVVANLTKTYLSVQDAATFAVGQGALAACPGDGCTFTSYPTVTTGGLTETVVVPGTAISWCPPANGIPPGTPNNQIGDWNCASQQGAATGALNVRIGISNSVGASHFGGTFSLLRNVGSNVWRVLVQPGTDGIAEVSRSWMDLANFAWTGGRPNFQYTSNPGNPGPRLKANLNANGAVTRTLGCVNPTGTPGGTFTPGSPPIVGPGSNCGTRTAPDMPGQGWGFKMTTGDVEGSDPWPFVGITSAVPPGTAFAPNANTRTPGQGFFFTRMGTDRATGTTRRNIVLLGGGVARDPNSGNLFFRITDLHLDLLVPEPAMGLGLIAGATALVALARRRRS
jgi:hypothetical protein